MFGTISELDDQAGLGLIDADDGRLVFFNLENVHASRPAMITIGSRVEFESHANDWGEHADIVLPAS